MTPRRRTRSFGQHATSRLDDLIQGIRSRQVVSNLPHGKLTAVDLGSGWNFQFLRQLSRQGRLSRGIAVDLHLDQSRFSKDIELLEADLNGKLPLEDCSATAVTSLAVIEHLDQPLLHMAEAHRILADGGVMVITTPSPRSKWLLELLAFRLHVIDEDEIRDHKHYFSRAELVDLAVASGFDRSSVTYAAFALGLNQLLRAAK